MENKYLLFLLGFKVKLIDRRNREEADGFIVVPYPEEHPEDMEDAKDIIKKHYGRLGFSVQEITHQESRVKEIDLVAEYDAAPNTDVFYEYGRVLRVRGI